MQLTFNRPIDLSTNLEWYKRFNWRWFFQRLPILALGIDNSYNVAKYVGLTNGGLLIQVIVGITFDIVFIGMIALADQFRTTKLQSVLLFWTINLIAMLVAAVLGTLAYSSGLYAAITLESLTRGIAFPLLGLLYNLYYFVVTSEVARDRLDQAKLLIEREQEDRKALLEKPYECEYCHARFDTYRKRNGHLARCQLRLS